MAWMARSRRGLTAAAVLVAVVCAVPQTAAAETVPLPSDAALGSAQKVELPSMVCPSAGNCVAAGWYLDAQSYYQGLVETETSGVWSAQKLSLASLVSPTANPFAGLSSIACPSVGNCVAVGSYLDTAGNAQGLIATEAGGSWSVARLPLTTLPSTATDPQVSLNSLSCPAAGSCVAVGDYTDATGSQQALMATEAAGTWTAHKAFLGSFSTWSNPYASLAQVACASPGDCAAVGSWRDSADNDEALMETETGGVWSTSRPDLSRLPSVASAPRDTLWGVSCPTVGGCTAAGYYLDGSAGGGTDQAMLVSQSGAAWGPATEALPPSNATAAGAQVHLYALSCVSAGDCTAVGDYHATAAGYVEGFGVTETAGTLSNGAEINLPADAAANPRAYISTIACTAPSSCVAGGSYDGSGGFYDVLVANQSGSNWTTAGLVQPTTTGVFPVNYANASCTPTGGYCAIGGSTMSWSTGNADIPYLLDAPAAVGTPSAAVSGTQATVSWGAPADNGGLTVTDYTVTATDLTNGSRGGQTATASGTSATLTGLTPLDTYTFMVTATSLLGSGLSATSASVTVPPSRQQLMASLGALLTPRGSASRLKKLVKSHGYTFVYTPLESGTVSVRWYETTGHGKHRHRHLFASGSAATVGTAATKVRVHLTTFGRRAVKAVKAGHKLRLSASVTFVGGGVKVTRTHSFTLH